MYKSNQQTRKKALRISIFIVVVINIINAMLFLKIVL